MSDIRLPEMEVELLAFTRAAMGIGIGLIAARYLTNRQRQLLGWSLVALGGLSTFPLRADVLKRRVNNQPPGRNRGPGESGTKIRFTNRNSNHA
jgi:hypothetical protein